MREALSLVGYKTDRIRTLDERDHRAITPLTPGFRAFGVLPADR